MTSIISINCPKCKGKLYKYGKTPDGFQKYQCKTYRHQFAPDKPVIRRQNESKHPRCPRCNKASFTNQLGKPEAAVSDRLPSYIQAVKSVVALNTFKFSL